MLHCTDKAYPLSAWPCLLRVPQRSYILWTRRCAVAVELVDVRDLSPLCIVQHPKWQWELGIRKMRKLLNKQRRKAKMREWAVRWSTTMVQTKDGEKRDNTASRVYFMVKRGGGELMKNTNNKHTMTTKRTRKGKHSTHTHSECSRRLCTSVLLLIK